MGPFIFASLQGQVLSLVALRENIRQTRHHFVCVTFLLLPTYFFPFLSFFLSFIF